MANLNISQEIPATGIEGISPQELLEFVNSTSGELAQSMGIVITEATAERLVGTMPVAGNRQPYGLLHGGANVVLAETLGSIGSAIVAGPNRSAVGLEVSATHHRSAVDGKVTAVANLISAGRTIAAWDIAITDESGKRTCTARLTCLLRDNK